MDRERFVRQMLVAEIGEAGQRAIAESTATVGGEGFAHEVATRYAAKAGFGAVARSSAELDAAAEPEWVREPSAREALAGSRAALRAILEAIRSAS